MRCIAFLSVITVLIVGVPAMGQPCAGYPANKTWTGGASGGLTVPDGAFPGWAIGENVNNVVEYPISVDSETAQRNTITDGKIKYTTANWTVNGGETISFTWRLYVSAADRSSPSIEIRNGAWEVTLDFEPNIGAGECMFTGWKGSNGTTIDAGGQFVGGARHLLMTMNEWHDLRVDVYADGTFDAWLDGGGSDWKHISGSTDETDSGRLIQWGQRSTRSGVHQWSTSCVAWAEGAEVPAPPGGPEEICADGIDNDGDDDVDCDDSDCDCQAIPVGCRQVTDIFEKFNVNMSWDAALPGKTAPGWSRDGYGHPASSDEDPTVPPGSSLWDIAPFTPNPGPYYFVDPGPYELERDEMEAACLAGEIDWDEFPDFVALNPGGACSPGNTVCCGNFAGWLFHPTQPQRVTLVLDQIDNAPDANPPGCGSTQPECMAGQIQIKRQTTVNDLAFLPIDWSDPVTISAEVGGIDHGIPADGSTYKWETFITYAVPGGIPAPVSETRIEWGSDGDRPNITSTAGYGTISVVVDPGQADTPGELIFGVDFDYIGLNPLPLDASTAFFENVRITYTPDTTAVLLHLNKMSITRKVEAGTSPTNDTFTVKNAGAGTMSYVISDIDLATQSDATWLSTSGGDGSSSGEADTITIEYDMDSLTPGTYTAEITVDSPANTKSPAVLMVTVIVAGPQIGLSTASFSHSILRGQVPASDTFDVSNVGIGSLTFSVSDDTGWLSTIVTSGGPLTSGQSEQVVVEYDTADLATGVYNATIEVMSPEAGNSPQSIDVTVTVDLNPPDYDQDNDVDQDDLAVWQTCYAGPVTLDPGFCADYADFNGDGLVDSQDANIFEGCASGPNIPFDVDCVANQLP